MYVVRVTALAGLALVAQIAVIAKMSVVGVRPDALLWVAIAVAVAGGRNRGALAGFIAGLTADVFMTSALGISALIYTLVCYTVGRYSQDVSSAPWVVAFVGCVASLVAFLAFVQLASLLGDLNTTVGHAIRVCVIEALLGALFTPLLAWICRSSWLERDTAW